jgi:hypothetical protein
LDAAAQGDSIRESSTKLPSTGMVLKCDEAQALFPAYLDNGLTPDLVKAVDAHLMECAPCNGELNKLRKEEDILVEALRELRPSDSYRGRVAAMCAQMHARASEMAESIPESRWAVFRYILGFIGIAAFVLVWMGGGQANWQDQWPSLEIFLQEARARPLFWVNVCVFAASGLLLLEGRFLARLNCYFMSRWTGQAAVPPTRLEIVFFEMVGALGVILCLFFHYLFVTA